MDYPAPVINTDFWLGAEEEQLPGLPRYNRTSQQLQLALASNYVSKVTKVQHLIGYCRLCVGTQFRAELLYILARTCCSK